MNAESYLIDKKHREKRTRNIKIALIFIDVLILLFVLSLAHSLAAEREISLAEKAAKMTSEKVEKILKENEILRDYLKKGEK